LGGGSSNAAALLRAADRLWRTHLSPDDLFEMCGKLGSDVPFFLRGGTQIGEGRGEKLTPMQLFSNYWVVLVFPGLHISTGWAYARARIALTKDEKITTFRPLFSALDPEEWKSLLINDLEAPVFAAYPLLKEVKKELYQEGAFYAAMSGSGSTLFGLFREEKRAREVCLFFRREKDVTVRIYRPVTNDGSGLGREPDGQG